MSDDLTTRPAVITQLLAVDDTGTVANYIRQLEALVVQALREADERLRLNPTDHLPHTVRDLTAALTAERQAREQAEQERDRLREALEHAAWTIHAGMVDEDGVPLSPLMECQDEICQRYIRALTSQDGQR